MNLCVGRSFARRHYSARGGGSDVDQGRRGRPARLAAREKVSERWMAGGRIPSWCFLVKNWNAIRNSCSWAIAWRFRLLFPIWRPLLRNGRGGIGLWYKQEVFEPPLPFPSLSASPPTPPRPSQCQAGATLRRLVAAGPPSVLTPSPPPLHFVFENFWNVDASVLCQKELAVYKMQAGVVSHGECDPVCFLLYISPRAVAGSKLTLLW